MTVCKPGIRPSPELDHSGPLISDFQPPKLKIFVVLSHPAYDTLVIAAWTKTYIYIYINIHTYMIQYYQVNMLEAKFITCSPSPSTTWLSLKIFLSGLIATLFSQFSRIRTWLLFMIPSLPIFQCQVQSILHPENLTSGPLFSSWLYHCNSLHI